MRNILVISFILSILILRIADIWAQETSLSTRTALTQTERQDSLQLDSNIIHLIHADTSLWEIFDDSTIQTYNGNVIIYSDSAFMYSDSAYIKDSTFLRAYENIVIQQGDTVQIFADTLFYSAETKLAELFGDVVLVNGEQKLYTNYLLYDMKTKIANYFSESTLTDGETFLSSKQGTFYVEDDIAFFKDSVRVVGPDFSVLSDSLEYQTKIKTVYFIGPTLIHQDNRKIYCESGYYDMINELSSFSKNAQFAEGDTYAEAEVIQYNRKDKIIEMQGDAFYQEKGRTASGDYIRYDEANEWLAIQGNGALIDSVKSIYSEEMFYDVGRDSFAVSERSIFYSEEQILEADNLIFNNQSGNGVAWGNVVWNDTINGLGIDCDSLIYNDLTGDVRGLGKSRRPLLWTLVDQDTMFIKADTLHMAKEVVERDTVRQLYAFHDVRIFKSDLQGIADSLVYNEADSTFTLLGQPMLWSDTSQFVADTINIFMKSGQLHNIRLDQNAFIINSPDEIFFNQIKGRIINAFFKDENLYLMDVNGNAQTVYYILDDLEAYVGVNKSTCSNIKIYFGSNQVESIKSFKDIDSTLFSMEGTDHDALVLEGYKWEIGKRPKSKNDLESKKAILR